MAWVAGMPEKFLKKYPAPPPPKEKEDKKKPAADKKWSQFSLFWQKLIVKCYRFLKIISINI